MHGKSWLIILGAAMATVAFSDHAFAACQGNACDDLGVQQSGACVVLVNRNARKAIKVVSIAMPSTVYDVPANSTITPTVWGGSGECHKTWFQNYNANYM